MSSFVQVVISQKKLKLLGSVEKLITLSARSMKMGPSQKNGIDSVPDMILMFCFHHEQAKYRSLQLSIIFLFQSSSCQS